MTPKDEALLRQNIAILSSVAKEISERGIRVGDTIEGREEYERGWNEGRLTLLWVGQSEAAWSEQARSSEKPKWSEPEETTAWTLAFRDWKIVSRLSKPSSEGVAGWKSIDSAPKDGTHIQLYRPEIQFVGFFARAGWVVNAPGLPLMTEPPTHWRECAPPPPINADSGEANADQA